MENMHAKAYAALQMVAWKEGTTLEDVVTSIEFAIQDAYDSKGGEAWKEIPCQGERPDALELMEYLLGKVECV